MSKRARAVEERHVSEEYAALEALEKGAEENEAFEVAIGVLYNDTSRLDPGDSAQVGDHVITNAGDAPIFTTPAMGGGGAFPSPNEFVGQGGNTYSGTDTETIPAEPLSDRRLAMRENFRRLASKRVTAILEALDRLKKLANTNVYDWTDEQEHKILGAISERFTEVGRAFEQAKRPRERATRAKNTFEL